MVLDVLLAFITAFILTYFSIPSIIKIAKAKHLYDEPDGRKVHRTEVPALGGIAIFAGLIFAVVFWMPFEQIPDFQYTLCSFIIIFLIGAKDDIIPLVPAKKLAGQLLAASILVFYSGIRLTSLHGILGINDIPLPVSYFLSIFTILVIINAFNLIDGINGLSASIGILTSLFFGIWFYLIDHLEYTILAFSLSGALLAFLRYNITPAKIFMGDTGSLLIGLTSSILTIKFIEFHNQGLFLEFPSVAVKAVPVVAIGVLILPLFDTLRVFILRIFKGKSPLHPDRTHIHHLLIDIGLSHMQATGILILTNIFFIVFVLSFQHIGAVYLLFSLLSLATILSVLLKMKADRKKFLQQSTA